MRLFLVRHPKPEVEQGVCYGASDVVCTAQALESAAENLLKMLPKGLKITSSPLSRCEHLAQILCRLDADFSYKTDEKLAEMHFGHWEMVAWEHIAQAELTAWADAFVSYSCGGAGESTALVLQRVAQLLHQHGTRGEDHIWITHAGVIRAVQWLGTQPYSLITSLIERLDPAPLLSHLRAADWPKGEVVFGQVCLGQPWDWPVAWPKRPLVNRLVPQRV